MNKFLVGCLAVLGFSGVALASDVTDTVAASPVATATSVNEFNSGVYVGLQGGYADNGIKSLDKSYVYDATDNSSSILKASDSKGFASRLFVGYDITNNFAIESGYFYDFKKAKSGFAADALLGDYSKVRTQAFDVSGKLSADIIDNFGVYAKAGVGYLMYQFKDSDSKAKTNSDRVDLVYGVGAYYRVTKELSLDVSYTKYNSGQTKLTSKNWQPSLDFYAVGMSYKFSI